MPSSIRVRAILFDLDGVLVDSNANVVRHWTAWATRHDIDPEWLVPRVHGRRAIDTIRAVAPDVDAEAELERLVRAESEDTAGVIAMAGAEELLASIPSDAWAVVTSGAWSVATARLRAASLPMPRVLVSADQVTRGKPDPEGYLTAAAALAAPAAECAVVEDAPAGAAAARAMGARLVALETTTSGDRLAPADLVLPDLRALALRADDGWLTLTRRSPVP